MFSPNLIFDFVILNANNLKLFAISFDIMIVLIFLYKCEAITYYYYFQVSNQLNSFATKF